MIFATQKAMRTLKSNEHKPKHAQESVDTSTYPDPARSRWGCHRPTQSSAETLCSFDPIVSATLGFATGLHTKVNKV